MTCDEVVEDLSAFFLEEFEGNWGEDRVQESHVCWEGRNAILGSSAQILFSLEP